MAWFSQSLSSTPHGIDLRFRSLNNVWHKLVFAPSLRLPWTSIIPWQQHHRPTVSTEKGKIYLSFVLYEVIIRGSCCHIFIGFVSIHEEIERGKGEEKSTQHYIVSSGLAPGCGWFLLLLVSIPGQQVGCQRWLTFLGSCWLWERLLVRKINKVSAQLGGNW